MQIVANQRWQTVLQHWCLDHQEETRMGWHSLALESTPMSYQDDIFTWTRQSFQVVLTELSVAWC